MDTTTRYDTIYKRSKPDGSLWREREFICRVNDNNNHLLQ